jgi:hypothetical protein
MYFALHEYLLFIKTDMRFHFCMVLIMIEITPIDILTIQHLTLLSAQNFKLFLSSALNWVLYGYCDRPVTNLADRSSISG